MHDIIIFKFEYSCFCCYFKQPACRFNKLEFDCICKLNSQNEKITYNAKFATIEEYGETKKSLMYSDFFVCKGLLLILLFADAILRKFINDAKKNFVNFYISNIYNVSLAHIS
jgi:protein associated with RNAse G/E